MISTSNRKLVALSALFILVIGSVSSSHYYDHNQGYSATQDTSFSIPEYESQSELATQLIAPFLLITIILQFGLERALRFTLAKDENPVPGSGDEGLRKNSLIMSLAITGMLVPTPFFELIRGSVSAIFGSLVLIFFGVVIAGFLLSAAR